MKKLTSVESVMEQESEKTGIANPLDDRDSDVEGLRPVDNCLAS